jgi:HEAT repeat protein
MMSDVRWKVSILFAIITLSIFFSIYLGSDGVIEGSGNQTSIQAGGVNASNSSVLNTAQIPDLIYTLKTGNNTTKYDAASKMGRLGKPAASALVKEIETNNSSSEGVNSYMLLALLETRDGRSEQVLSEDFGKKASLKNNTTGGTVEGQTGREMSEDTLQALKAKDKDMRKRLADSIDREYGNKTDDLENTLKSDEQNSSIYTSFAFSELGPQEPGSETEKLLKALKSGNGSIRIAAMMALGENKEKAALDPLNDILLRDYPLAKNSAIIALGEIGDERAVEILIKQMQSDSEFTRSSDAIALGKIGSEKALTHLIARLRDVSAGVRSSSALSLARLGNKTAADPLIVVLESGKSYNGKANDSTNAIVDVRKSTILALGELGDTRATEDIIDILTDKTEKKDVRLAAASALGEIGDPRAVETLKTVIDNKSIDREIRKKAFLALSKTKSQEIVEILVGKLGDNEFGDISRGALINTGEMAVDPLIENLKTKDRKIKNETALILIEIGDPRAIKPLVLAYEYY